jgi:hypothetical protein
MCKTCKYKRNNLRRKKVINVQPTKTCEVRLLSVIVTHSQMKCILPNKILVIAPAKHIAHFHSTTHSPTLILLGRLSCLLLHPG